MTTLKSARWLTLIAGTVLFSSMAGAAEIEVDARHFPGSAWSPYVVGALIGVLSWLTFYFSNKPIGASSFYASVAGMVGKLVARKHVANLSYYKSNPPSVNWEFAFVIATIAGGFLGAFTGGELSGEWVPAMWAARFGEDSFSLRMGAAIVGGLLMAFGARIAGGCTSGHGISGSMQLSVGSWIAVICFFIGGIPVAMLLFSK